MGNAFIIAFWGYWTDDGVHQGDTAALIDYAASESVRVKAEKPANDKYCLRRSADHNADRLRRGGHGSAV